MIPRGEVSRRERLSAPIRATLLEIADSLEFVFLRGAKLEGGVAPYLCSILSRIASQAIGRGPSSQPFYF